MKFTFTKLLITTTLLFCVVWQTERFISFSLPYHFNVNARCHNGLSLSVMTTNKLKLLLKMFFPIVNKGALLKVDTFYLLKANEFT